MQQKGLILCLLVAFVSIANANEYRPKKSLSRKSEDDKTEDEIESQSLYNQEVRVCLKNLFDVIFLNFSLSMIYVKSKQFTSI